MRSHGALQLVPLPSVLHLGPKAQSDSALITLARLQVLLYPVTGRHVMSGFSFLALAAVDSYCLDLLIHGGLQNGDILILPF